MDKMGRGEMIRRLDEASKEVHERLTSGPLTPDERHTLAATLERLLPLVAGSLQDQEDREAIAALQRVLDERPPDGGTDKPD
jgi:hypothetical protein